MIAVAAFLTYCTYNYLTGPLITPPREVGFIERTEQMVTAMMIPIFSFVLPNKFEIELSLTCGTSTSRLFFTKAIPSFIYTVIPSLVFVFLYEYVPYEGNSPRKIPIYVPENYLPYVIVSLIVTLLFFFSLCCFVRVLSRNCYVPMLFGLFLHASAITLCKGVQSGQYEITKSIMDPYITVYFVGDEVPNAIAEKYPQLSSLSNVWTHNRLLFLGISVALLTATYILLRREKLHRGFGE